ncbi:hypothetical protein BSKO_00269 [Bryopsis sp. KO-2023]|nr:hypothetical protein BSKO_00269 [Bryopsis sp. KO-2023]
MEGSAWFYNAPVHPDALVWSEDDLLAVATGSVVAILNPFDISGGRAYVNFSDERDVGGWAPGCVPEDPEPCLKMALCCLNELRFRDTSWAPHVRSVDWSPSGSGPDGGCLLAATLSDHHVFICSPALKSCAEWSKLVDLGTQLKEHMRKTRWDEKGKGGSNPIVKEEEMLRLKGGGIESDGGGDEGTSQNSTTWKLSPNDGVEVMNTNILKGIWFEGVVLKVIHGYALVEYAMLHCDYSGKEKLREWFPVPGHDSTSRGKLPRSDVINDFDSAIRPTPPANLVALTTAECKPGGSVDTFDDAYWMSAEIISVNESEAMLEIKLANSVVVQRVKCSSVRKISQWGLDGWSVEGREGGITIEEEGGIAVEEEGGVGAIPDDEEVSEEATPPPRTSRKRKPRRASQPRVRRKKTEPPGPYKVPDDFDPSVLGQEIKEDTSSKLRLELAKTGLFRWMNLRSVLPEDKVEIYELREAMKGEDLRLHEQTIAELVHVYGPNMEKVGLTESELRKELRTNIRRKAICSHNAVYRSNRNLPMLPKSMLPIIGQEPSNPLAGTGPRKRTRPSQLWDEAVNATRNHAQTAADQEPRPLATSRARSRHKKRISRDIKMSTIGCLVVQDTYDSWKKVKPNKKKRGIHQLKVGQGPVVPNELYEYRLSLVAAKCVAWSPSVRISNCKASVIAVGTESGHVVLWKGEFHGPYVDSATMKDAATVLGSVEVHSGEISTLKWHLLKVDKNREFLVLVSGGVMGDVRLTAFRPDDLAEVTNECNELLGSLLLSWGWVCPPDMQPVGCVSVGLDLQSNGDALIVGIGKSGGGVAVWHSPSVKELAGMDGDSWAMRGELIRIPWAHSAFGVTGVSCGLVGGMVVSCGMDGSVKCWKREGSSYTEVQGPQQISEETPNDPTHMPFGVVRSQNGLLLAVLKDQGRKLWDAQVQKMTWKRIAHSSIEMVRIHGNSTAVSHKEALAGMGMKEPHSIVSMSDIAVTILSGHTDSNESKAGGEGGSDSEKDEGRDREEMDRERSNVKIFSASLAKTILMRLEQEFNILNFESFQDIPSDTWPRLRLAVSLRYMLRKDLESTPQNPAPAGLQAEDRTRMEFYLLQHHVCSVIEKRMIFDDSESPCGLLPEGEDPWKFIAGTMCRWVSRHHSHPDMHPELVKAAEKVVSDASHAPETDPFSEGSLAFGSGPPVTSARTAVSSAIDFELVRCGSSLLACASVPSKWECLICKRKYMFSPVVVGPTGSHECLYCGIVLTSVRGEMCLAAAGAYYGKYEESQAG